MTRKQGITLIAIGTIVLVFTAILALRPLSGWEEALFIFLNGWQAPAFIEVIARILSDIVWAIVFASIAIILFWPSKRVYGWNVGVAIGLAYVVSAIVERLVDRGRPDAVLPSDTVMRAHQDGMGFPSGHETAIVATVLILWPYLSRPWKIVAVMVCILVGWSRVFLGVHLPLDIVGGAAIACIVVGGLKILPESWQKRLHII